MKTSVLVIPAVFLAFFHQLLVMAETNVVESATQVLGGTRGRPITNGFVFIDGKYIPPPYIVSREGNSILINGFVVETPCPWPIPPAKAIHISPIEEPKIPQSVSLKTSKYDKILQKYIAEKEDYLRNHFNDKGFADALAKAYSDLPCVKKVESKNGAIAVVWETGERDDIFIEEPMFRKSTQWTCETIITRVDNDRANYEKCLNRGDYYFLGSETVRMTGTAAGSQAVLGALLPILKTSKDAKEVHQRMSESGFSGFDERTSQTFFNKFVDSEELELRVKQLTQPSTTK